MLTDHKIVKLKEASRGGEAKLAKYLEHPEITWSMKNDTARLLTSKGVRGDSVLDIGCGVPYLLDCFRDLGANTVQGIDGWEEAKETGDILGVPVTVERVRPGMRIPGKYDVVLSFRCNFVQIGRAEELMPLLESCVADKGWLVISPNNGQDPWFDEEVWEKNTSLKFVERGLTDGGQYLIFRKG